MDREGVAVITRTFQWILAAFLTLLTFLASTLWYDQRHIAEALGGQTGALVQLTQEFHDYLKLNEMRFLNADQDRDRLRDSQQKILDRLDRAGMRE